MSLLDQGGVRPGSVGWTTRSWRTGRSPGEPWAAASQRGAGPRRASVGRSRSPPAHRRRRLLAAAITMPSEAGRLDQLVWMPMTGTRAGEPAASQAASSRSNASRTRARRCNEVFTRSAWRVSRAWTGSSGLKGSSTLASAKESNQIGERVEVQCGGSRHEPGGRPRPHRLWRVCGTRWPPTARGHSAGPGHARHGRRTRIHRHRSPPGWEWAAPGSRAGHPGRGGPPAPPRASGRPPGHGAVGRGLGRWARGMPGPRGRGGWRPRPGPGRARSLSAQLLDGLQAREVDGELRVVTVGRDRQASRSQCDDQGLGEAEGRRRCGSASDRHTQNPRIANLVRLQSPDSASPSPGNDNPVASGAHL